MIRRPDHPADTTEENSIAEDLIALNAASVENTPPQTDAADADTPVTGTPSERVSWKKNLMGVLKTALHNLGMALNGLIGNMTGDGSIQRLNQAVWGPHQGETLVMKWREANPGPIVFRRQEGQYYNQDENRFLTDAEAEELDLPMDRAVNRGRVAFKDAAEGNNLPALPEAQPEATPEDAPAEVQENPDPDAAPQDADPEVLFRITQNGGPSNNAA